MLLSIPLFGNSYPGAQGHVSLSYFHESGPMGPTSGQVRVGVPQQEGVVWLDILYTLETQSAPVFSMDIETGVAAVSFSSATITSPPPVIHP